MIGYVISYSTKNSFFDSLSKAKKALVTPAQLIEIINGSFDDKFTTLWQATFVNIEEYRQTHEPGTYTDFVR